MGTPTTTNGTATAVDNVINDAVKGAENAADLAAEAALGSAVPFFELPVIKQITDATIEEIVSLIGEKISVSLQTIGTFIVIDTQVSSEKAGISKALADLMLAEKSGAPKRIREALVEYQNAQSALINDDGSAPPVS